MAIYAVTRMRWLLVAAALVFGATGAPSKAAVTPSFKILVPPSSFGDPVYGEAISGDGSTVVGTWFLPGSDPACGIPGGCGRAFRWTAATGFQDLGLAGGVEAEVSDVNSDGSLVVASAGTRTAFRRAVVWTASSGFVDIGTPYYPSADPAYSVSYGYAISGNGSVVVGRAIPTTSSLIPHSMSLTASGLSKSFSFIAELPNTFQAQANAVSDDGKVIVGFTFDNSFGGHSYRWQGGSVQDLGNLGLVSGEADATSSDGSVVVGSSNISNCGLGCPHAYRWTASGGIKDIGTLQNGGMYLGEVSADGTVVVGSGAAGGGGVTHPFRWTSQKGLEDLNNVLASLGVNTNGYELVFATGISADGTTIVGSAQNASLGTLFPFVAVIPPPQCARLTCSGVGKNCGSVPDGCGGTLNCGLCSGSQTCGGGKANVCGPCTPTTCAAQGKNCNGIPDGCGSWLSCGTCAGTQTCAGAGTANVCGTPPPFPIDLTFNPNPVVGGNNTIGTVTLSSSAPGGGAVVTLSCSNSSVCTCPPSVTVPAGQTGANFTAMTSPPAQNTSSMNAACLNGQCYNTGLSITTACLPGVCMSGNCGTINDGCGGTLSCGSCPSGQVCTNGTCMLSCTPTTCAAQGKSCGSISDGCGGTLTCGTCASPQTCGGGGTPNVCGGGGGGGTNTGLRSPTANAATGDGDGNGFESSPTNAYAADGAFAVDNNSGSGSSTSCTDRSKDKHRFYNYGFTFPGGVSIRGIEVRLDAKVDSTSSSPKMCVQLSWDGGSSWTSTKSTPTLGTSVGTYTLGGSTDTWGRSWTTGSLTNANFRVRIIDNSSSTSRDFSLDWVAVRVHYQ